MEEAIDKVKAERSEIESLIERGMSFNVGKRQFTIREPYLGTLDHLARLFIDMQFDESRLQEDPLGESKLLAGKHAKECAKIVAVAVLNNRIKILLLTGIFSRYLLWRVKPSHLMKLALIINSMCNFSDFIHSIRLMSAARTTAPDRIEQRGKA